MAGAFDRVAVDILRPLPLTERGNKYVVVFTDYSTKYAEAFALPNQTATAIAKTLVENIICRHSPPRFLLSDLGANFLSELVAETYKYFEISKINTSS